ncbi:hypothetical protein RRG08_014182 [Elysia crispata]|uniref:Uncharacterized protein n=1 Tax=Elysia crispata TaxID=231223 RepID=A0AAE1D8W2_9GAST|nr:hypothetical protein RRG08_014182 [Elysia crispata]
MLSAVTFSCPLVYGCEKNKLKNSNRGTRGTGYTSITPCTFYYHRWNSVAPLLTGDFSIIIEAWHESSLDSPNQEARALSFIRFVYAFQKEKSKSGVKRLPFDVLSLDGGGGGSDDGLCAQYRYINCTGCEACPASDHARELEMVSGFCGVPFESPRPGNACIQARCKNHHSPQREAPILPCGVQGRERHAYLTLLKGGTYTNKAERSSADHYSGLIIQFDNWARRGDERKGEIGKMCGRETVLDRDAQTWRFKQDRARLRLGMGASRAVTMRSC